MLHNNTEVKLGRLSKLENWFLDKNKTWKTRSRVRGTIIFLMAHNNTEVRIGKLGKTRKTDCLIKTKLEKQE